MSVAPQHHRTFVDGQLIHYVRAGQGPAVLLLHGWPATWAHWRHLIPRLADAFTVVAPDLRGFGDSGKPPVGYDTRSIVRDVRGLVHQLGFDAVHLVGHDMGGVHAYTYAAEHPGEVRSLAYLDEPLPSLSYEGFAALKPEPAWQGGFWFAHFHLVPQLPEALTAGRERIYLQHVMSRMAYDPSVFDAAYMDELVRCFGGGGMGRVSACTARSRPPSRRSGRTASAVACACRCSPSAGPPAWGPCRSTTCAPWPTT